MHRTPLILLVLVFSLFTTPLFAKEYSLKEIIGLKNAPDGVVIEIVTGDEAGLEWALPKSREYIAKLRKQFPKLDIAIVTHGQEQFTLTKDNKKEQKQVHSLTQVLKKEKVQLHVCGTYAGWRGLSDEDFPDYVDVAATGSAQVNDYIAVGYLLLVIRDEDD